MKQIRNGIFWGATALVASLALRAIRPAPLRSASLTAITPGRPPTANIALAYGHGTLPVSVIVDLRDQRGYGGSATYDGDHSFIEVPLNGPPDATYQISITVAYRVAGFPYIAKRTFAQP